MKAFALFVLKGKLHIAYGLDAAENLAHQAANSPFADQATGFLVKTQDGVPVVEGIMETQFWGAVFDSVKINDYNAWARDMLGGMFGIIAGIYTLPAGPASALFADTLASTLFTESYDWVTNTFATPALDVFMDFLESNKPDLEDVEYDIMGNVSSRYLGARSVVQQRDPLIMDLDGDGLELSAASGITIFDHNADGIKTGTGWARPDDGFLVRDLNGNGLLIQAVSYLVSIPLRATECLPRRVSMRSAIWIPTAMGKSPART